MKRVYATVSSKGQLVIPAAIREKFGMQPGTRVAIRQQGQDLVLTPATRHSARQLIEGLCGITGGGPSMTDELIAERRAEEEKARW